MLTFKWDDGQHVTQIGRLEAFVQSLKKGDEFRLKQGTGKHDLAYKAVKEVFDDIQRKGKIENYMILLPLGFKGLYPVQVGNQRLSAIKAGVLSNLTHMDCRIIPPGKTYRDVIRKYPYKIISGFYTPDPK